MSTPGTADSMARLRSYSTAAGGAAFLGVGLGNTGVVWAFVLLYGAAFVMVRYLKVPEDDRSVRRAPVRTEGSTA